METKLIKIGNSFGIRIPKSLIKQYNLVNEIEIDPTRNGILIKSKTKARAGWEKQLETAIKAGYKPDDELTEGFTDEFTETEWQW
ncbi:AbrB/MazE/SpoVT family DNA-binding domain-containing protein [Mucilaginibacter glaciei]|uniref:AbrB/MazE/SpoVT family DNA-binding domain-containing protein n=1 Tax=Mucilaginibacter glaciei TaxID=2772109 RepID=A0A926S1B2_9SPHI|nr:AbrB/MazE/SpoVT family DNA-binding domain-containing protein [Mucilaginibacter glaciei]MBD1393835.1 AbrB/MazE/SpoVT family DNA-binding domain-containing protein [Mucilaginibacter glaciei]